MRGLRRAGEPSEDDVIKRNYHNKLQLLPGEP